MEPKKASIIRILEILNKHSDEEHPLTQTQIAEILYNTYGIDCERKAISRNLTMLQEMNIADIVVTGRGCYIREKVFEEYELRLLIDSVLSSKHINPTHTKHLISKLEDLGTVFFQRHNRHVVNVGDWQKSDNQQFFLNIDIIDEAIDKGQQVAFFYNKYDITKKLRPTKTEKHVVNPYQFVLHNQHYYLVGNVGKYEDLTFFRVDKITEAEILPSYAKDCRQLRDYKNGLNLAGLCTTLPYLFTDKQERIVLKCKNQIVDEVFDWFGTKSVKTRPLTEGYFEASVNSSPRAMFYWAMQYNTSVEVISPASLRTKIVECLTEMCDMYGVPDNGNR